ncbi:MAG: ABC transporter permease [Acidobacteriota bacterium]|nr:ABC transporter permease [Acidobacteriota bacterium]
MFDLDNWHEIYSSLAKNRLRTALTAFGVFWGIFMLMVLLGSGRGLENGVNSDFSGTATNSFYIWTWRTSKPYRGLPSGRRFELSNRDTEAIRHEVPEAAVIAPRNQLGGFRGGNNVTRGIKAGAFNVMGDYPQILDIQPIRIVDGRFLNAHDLEEARKVAVIGSRVREVLFTDDEEPIGDYIKINGVYFKVVGIFTPRTQGEQSLRDAETIYAPFTTFQRAFNYGDQVGWFAITSAAEVSAEAVEEKVIALLKRRHKIHPDDTRAIGHWNTEEEFRKVQGLFAGIRMLIWIVGVGTLAAGVIGVSNIMLIVVKERTKEIGLRRAIGAAPVSIVGQILLESIVLTGLAGYLGLLGGVALVEGVRFGLETAGVNAQMFQNPGVSFSNATQALLILVASGTLAGLIPARRALAISPVEALHAV